MKKEKRVRENGNAESPKTQGQTATLQAAENSVKSAGHPTAENEWFNIGLSPLEVAMLKKIQAVVWREPEESTRAKTIRLLILAGLTHYSDLAKVLFGDARYCSEEGFDSYDLFFEGGIKCQLDICGADLAAIRESYRSGKPAAGKGGAI